MLVTKNSKASKLVATAGLSFALMIGGAAAAHAQDGSGDNGSGDNGSGTTTTTTTTTTAPTTTTTAATSPSSLPNTGADLLVTLGGAGALSGIAFAVRRAASRSVI